MDISLASFQNVDTDDYGYLGVDHKNRSIVLWYGDDFNICPGEWSWVFFPIISMEIYNSFLKGHVAVSELMKSCCFHRGSIDGNMDTITLDEIHNAGKGEYMSLKDIIDGMEHGTLDLDKLAVTTYIDHSGNMMDKETNEAVLKVLEEANRRVDGHEPGYYKRLCEI